MHEKYKSIIVETEFAPQKIYAIDAVTNEEILLFDGCKHGYDVMTWMEFSAEQINDREAEIEYKINEKSIFEIVISTYYQINYDEECKDDLDDFNQIEVNSGKKIPFEVLKRNGFGFIRIIAIDESNNRFEILSKECN